MGNSEPSTQTNVKTQNNSTPRSRHTPGPWNSHKLLSASENDKGFRVSAPNGTDGLTWIADVSPVIDNGRGEASEQGNANARLIAAAPELLEACLFVLKYEPTMGSVTEGLLRVVVAKAEGTPSVPDATKSDTASFIPEEDTSTHD